MIKTSSPSSFQRTRDWLYENSGPVIRLRLIREFGIDPTAEDQTLAEVLDLPETQFWLDNLQISKRVHDSHSDRLENIAGKLNGLGLSGYTDLFDPYLDDWKRQLAASRDDTTFFAGYTRAMLCACFRLLGYDHKNVRDVAHRRLDVLYAFCKQGDYDIYLPENHFGDLPQQRAGKPLVNPDLYPEGTVKLPSVYDMIWFPLLYTGETRQHIDTVVKYILTEAYQQDFRPGYGNIRQAKRHYYSMGWSVHVPGFQGFPATEPHTLVLYVMLLAPFASANQGPWFASVLDHLDSFRTDRGTWRFPGECLTEKGKGGGYSVMGYHMGIGENRRRKQSLELESTFYMLKILKLAGRL